MSDGNEVKTDGTPYRVPTESEIERYDLAQEVVSRYPFHQSFDPNDGNQRLFFAAFDGTWNDRDEMVVDTNPAELERLIVQQVAWIGVFPEFRDFASPTRIPPRFIQATLLSAGLV